MKKLYKDHVSSFIIRIKYFWLANQGRASTILKHSKLSSAMTIEFQENTWQFLYFG